MQAGTKANISVAFAVLGPLLLWLGLLAMGAPAHSPTSDPVARSALVAQVSIYLGLALVASSIGLSIVAFRAAPRRASSAWLVCVGLIVGLVFFG